MFDSVVKEALEKFNTGGKAGDILAALLKTMTNPATGGFQGFVEKFRRTGLGDLVDSWIRVGDNRPISNERLEATLGASALGSIAEQAGVDRTTATTVVGFMTPRVVDALTPNGDLPNEANVLKTIKQFSGGFDATNTAAGVSAGDPAKLFRYVLPFLLLAVLLGIVGYFVFKPHRPAMNTGNAEKANQPTVATTATVAKIVESTFKIEAKNGSYTISGLIADLETFDKIKAKLTAQFGEGNVNFAKLRVDPTTKPFAEGWWSNFSPMLPTLKDWKNGTLAFNKNSVTAADGLPLAAITQLKSLFAEWTLPSSVIGAENTIKQSNQEALKELGNADTIDEVIGALNISIINFKSGSAEIPADARPILAKAAEILKKQVDGTIIEIGGYTDNAGDPENNKKLSQSRADAVKKALVGLGVKDAMLNVVGYGDAKPVGDNETEDGRFRNRRIEYKKAQTAPTAS